MDENIILRKKRTGLGLLTTALALSMILPICFLITRIADLRLILQGYSLILWLISLLTAGAAVLLWKLPAPGVGIARMAAAFLPVSFLNSFFCLSGERKVLTWAGAVCALVLAILLFARFAKATRLRWFFGALTAALTVLVLAILPFALMGSLLRGSAEVVRRVESPQGGYVAEIISDDQGAMGGSTRVELSRPDRVWNLILLRIEETPRRIYDGDFGKAETLSVSWQDEQTLIIDGKVYPAE